MAERTIKMPDIGEGIAEVELVAWHVKPGDTVAEDQALADVMTDKASVEIPSPVSGTVTWIGGAEGTVFAVGAELVKIQIRGEAAVATPASAPRATAAAPPAAKAIPAAPAPSAAPAPAPARVAPSADRPIATPSVRRRAWELGIDLAQVKPSGTAGRVMQADLDGHAKAHPAAARPLPVQTQSAPATPSGTPRSGEESIPVIGLRRKIALKMQESKRRIPHFSYVEEMRRHRARGAARRAQRAAWRNARQAHAAAALDARDRGRRGRAPVGQRDLR